MYQMSLPLSDQNQPLRVEWELGWNNLTLHLGDQLIGTAAERADLEVGQTFYLPDGQSLIVVLRDPELEIWYRGMDVVNGIANGQRDSFLASARSLRSIGGMQCVGAVVYCFFLPPYLKWPVAVIMSLSGIFFIVSWEKMYSPRYKWLTWFALFACFAILPLFILIENGIEIFVRIVKDLTTTLKGKPPRFPSAKGG